MSVEEQLKELILTRYASIREFTIVANIPYSTLDTILKRGIQKATVGNVITICNALQISADALAEGKIEPLTTGSTKVDIYDQLNRALTMLKSNRGVYLGDKEASVETVDYVSNSLEICLEMIKKREKS